jgi:type II secretory pathway component GspD/PulD (secretin)
MPPAINEKSLSTELVVPDNSTLMMGGMIKSEKTTVLTGIPFLMDIPVLGWIFRKNTLSDKRTELLILITVNVVDTQNPQEELIRRYKASLEEIEASNNARNNY